MDEEKKPRKKSGRVDVAKAKKMLAQGATMDEVADRLGVTKRAIYARLKQETEMVEGVGKGGMAQGLETVQTLGSGKNLIVDPKTNLVVDAHGTVGKVIGRMGDERVSAFVEYHMECLAMRQGVNKQDPNDLYERFMRYLVYCQQHGVVPGAANARLAIGVSIRDIADWENGRKGTPEHKAFAEDFKAVLASVNEQAAADGILNPVLSIFWSKAYYGLTDQPKVEVEVVNPLGDKQSADKIAQKYADILPEDD